MLVRKSCASGSGLEKMAMRTARRLSAQYINVTRRGGTEVVAAHLAVFWRRLDFSNRKRFLTQRSIPVI